MIDLAGHILIVCASTHHMLVADKLLTANNIAHTLVPIPAKYGVSCSTGLKVEDTLRGNIESLLNGSWVKLVGIFPYEATGSDQLLERLTTRQQGILGALQAAANGEILSAGQIQKLLEAQGSLREKVRQFAYKLVKEKWRDYLLVGCLTIGQQINPLELKGLDRAAGFLDEHWIKNVIVKVTEEFSGPVQGIPKLLRKLMERYSFNLVPYLPSRLSTIYPELAKLGINQVNFYLSAKMDFPEQEALRELMYLRENPGQFLGVGKLLPNWDVQERVSESCFYRMAVARIALGKVDIPCFTGDVVRSLQAGANIVIYEPDREQVTWEELEQFLVTHLGVSAREISERRQPTDG